MAAITSAVQGFDLPDTWRRKRIKYVATYNDEALSDDTDEFKDIEYIEISGVSLVGGVESTSELQFHAAPSRARRVVRSGDTLVSTVRTYLKAIATVTEAPDNLIASTGFCVIRPGEEIDAAFLGWVMKSEPIVGEIVARSVGVSYPATNASEVVKLEVPLPDLDTQRRIAGYLDDKTARIDALIEKKRALLDRLAEKRQALITRAVTRGLNPTAPLKDSGIDWLGKVPAHWTTANIRRFAKMRTGHTPSRSVDAYWDDCTIPWFTLADIWQLRDGRQWYLGETSERISELGLANSAAELLPAGTVVLSRTASVGFSGIMPQAMATSQDFWNWICADDLRPEYLLLLFRSMGQEFERTMAGSTHQTIYKDVAAGLKICVPPLDEQDAIIARLRPLIEAHYEVEAHVAASIEKLTEYRAALVTAAVTGEIKALLVADDKKSAAQMRAMQASY